VHPRIQWAEEAELFASESRGVQSDIRLRAVAANMLTQTTRAQAFTDSLAETSEAMLERAVRCLGRSSTTSCCRASPRLPSPLAPEEIS